MAADDPKDAKKEFDRVKDNAGLEHKPKNVPREGYAPPGASGTEYSLAPVGPGSTSQRTYERHRTPQQGRDQKTPDSARSPEKSEASQKKQFQKRELSEQFKERSGAPEKGDGPQKGEKHFEKRQLTRDFNERSR